MYAYINIFAFSSICGRLCVCVLAYVCIYLHMWCNTWWICVCTCMCMYVCVRKCVFVCERKCVLTCVALCCIVLCFMCNILELKRMQLRECSRLSCEVNACVLYFKLFARLIQFIYLSHRSRPNLTSSNRNVDLLMSLQSRHCSAHYGL